LGERQRGAGERQQHGEEWREGEDPLHHGPRREGARGEHRRDEQAHGGQDHVGAELVDEDSQADVLAAEEALDHRQAHEGGVAERPGQDERTRGGRRPAEEALRGEEERHPSREQQPRHQERRGEACIEAEVAQVVQGERRQRHVHDEAVQCRRGRLGQAAGAPEHHAEDEAEREEGEILHGPGASAPGHFLHGCERCSNDPFHRRRR